MLFRQLGMNILHICTTSSCQANLVKTCQDSLVSLETRPLIILVLPSLTLINCLTFNTQLLHANSHACSMAPLWRDAKWLHFARWKLPPGCVSKRHQWIGCWNVWGFCCLKAARNSILGFSTVDQDEPARSESYHDMIVITACISARKLQTSLTKPGCWERNLSSPGCAVHCMWLFDVAANHERCMRLRKTITLW